MAKVLLRAVPGHSSCGNTHRDPEENVGNYTSVLWCKNVSAEPFQEIDCFSISPRDYLISWGLQRAMEYIKKGIRVTVSCH